MELILPHCLDMNIWRLALEQRMCISIGSTRSIKVTLLHQALLLPIVEVLGVLLVKCQFNRFIATEELTFD